MIRTRSVATAHRPGSRHRRAAAIVISLGATLALVTSGPMAQAAVTSPYAQKSIVTLGPGITHAKGVMKTTGGLKQAVQVGRIDPTNPAVRIRALLSNDKVIQTEPPSMLADRKSSPGNLAMLATNGDVSIRGKQDGWAAPHSLHVSGGEVMVAQECARPTLGLDEDGTARITSVRVRTRMELGATRPGYRTWEGIKGVNTPRTDDEIILYTPRFGPSTLTSGAGTEVVVSYEGKLRPWGSLPVTVVDIREGGSNTPIGDGRMVISGNGSFTSVLAALHVGQAFTLETIVLQGTTSNPCGPPVVEAPAWKDVMEALGGNWYVANGGAVAAPSSSVYPGGTIAAPRTSVGVTADGKVLMVVVDGRQGGYSVGVTLAEMGQLMLSLGAVSAINLDGGGSTVMATRPPGASHITVSNRPSDGRERSLTQALAAFNVDGS